MQYQHHRGARAPRSSAAWSPASCPICCCWHEPQLRDLAGRGTLVDLSTFLDEASARRAHSDYLIDLVSERSGFYAIPTCVDLKGLVWYPVPEFDAAGYTVPRTWDELLALSRQMVADGRHPWCLGIESDVASGWPATDWIEALVLRLGGVELYDQWVAHEIPFDHPVVRQATSMFGEIAFGPGLRERRRRVDQRRRVLRRRRSRCTTTRPAAG